MAEVDTIDIPDVTPVTRTVATMSKLIKTTGLPADAAATQTDTTPVTHTSIFKQLSIYLGTLAGAVSSSKVATKAAAADFADGAIATLGLKADAKSTATDTTPITLMSVFKQISASLQTLVSTGVITVGSAKSPPGGTTVVSNQLVADLFGQYEIVAASQTAQALGATGASGDYLAYVTVFPGTAGCGVVTILDNATTIGTFAGGGTTALPSLVPFTIQIGLYSTSGAWKITTGANVTVVGVGAFT